MQIIFQTKEKTLIVKLIGELDHHVAGGVKERIDKKITSGAIKNLIFDFSALSFMDSSGIGVVIGRYKLIKSLGGSTVIVSNAKSIDRLLNIAGIKKIISVENDIEGAVSALKEG
ncbi:MAG: anti-sigma F factor antagonist [Oscillospiraceae bacterium]|nr:anti-sigma F factor antagonist [Oscillospiraceae bacterium]